MKYFVAAAFGFIAIGAFAAGPAMAGITADQEAAQLDMPTPTSAAPPAAQAAEPNSSWPYAFNGGAQERIANSHHFGNLDQLPRSAAQMP
jgi:hypothetical protein